MRILVCIDATPAATAAARFAGPWLTAPGHAVTLFGAVERGRDEAAIRQALGAARAWIAPLNPDVATKVVHHRAADAILVEAESGAYDLVILGHPGRRGLARLLGGSLTERVVRNAPCAVLVAHAAPASLRRILVCTAGGPPGLHDVAFVAPLAKVAGVPVTVLHVMSQVALREDVDTRDLGASAEDLVARGAPEGRHLEVARGMLDDAGVESRIKVRHGLVIDQIDAEVRSGGYDVVAVGASLSRGLSRFVLDNVTRDVMQALADVAILVVGRPDAAGERSGAT